MLHGGRRPHGCRRRHSGRWRLHSGGLPLPSAGLACFISRCAPPPPAAATDAPVFRPGLLSEDSQAALKAAYDSSSPYPHSVIKDLCNPDLLRKVLIFPGAGCWGCDGGADVGGMGEWLCSGVGVLPKGVGC